jgi:hypothetical protein
VLRGGERVGYTINQLLIINEHNHGRGGKKEIMYNLTENQQEVLSWIVRQVRNHTLSEEFLVRHSYYSISCSIWSSDIREEPDISLGMLDAFAESDVMIVKKIDRPNTDDYEGIYLLCTLRRKAYEAVDTNFGIKISIPTGTSNVPTLSIFGPPDKKYTYDLFMLMPFLPELKRIYDDHIRKVANTLSLSIARADDFFSQNSIVQEIWSAIAQAKILIADCTGKNPNVFYEIGIAHAINKPVILITQKPEDVPFDLRHRRYIQYEYTPPGMEKFERDLAATIVETQKDLTATEK